MTVLAGFMSDLFLGNFIAHKFPPSSTQVLSVAEHADLSLARLWLCVRDI